MIRVTGGTLRGRKLRTPPERITRPPTDRVRQAAFNILGMQVKGACLLDLFAGSGSYSIEAISRGAESATLVEIHPIAQRVIRENLSITGLEERCRLIPGDVLRVIPILTQQYSVVIIAPPHFLDLLDPTLNSVAEHDVLLDGGTVMVQHHQDEPPVAEAGILYLQKQKRYGTTILSWYGKT